MANAKQILLVEGDADKSFFQKMCKNLSLDTSVQVAPPKDLLRTHNSKQAILGNASAEILQPTLNANVHFRSSGRQILCIRGWN